MVAWALVVGFYCLAIGFMLSSETTNALICVAMGLLVARTEPRA